MTIDTLSEYREHYITILASGRPSLADGIHIAQRNENTMYYYVWLLMALLSQYNKRHVMPCKANNEIMA